MGMIVDGKAADMATKEGKDGGIECRASEDECDRNSTCECCAKKNTWSHGDIVKRYQVRLKCARIAR